MKRNCASDLLDAFEAALPEEAISVSSRGSDFFLERKKEQSTDFAVRTRTPRVQSALRPAAVLNQFECNAADLCAFHLPVIERLARYIVGRAGNHHVIGVIRLVAHSDPTESNCGEPELGQQRAMATERSLRSAIERLWPGLNERIRFVTQSQHEAPPVTNSRTSVGRALNRRVEVFLSLNPAAIPVRYPVIHRSATLKYAWSQANSVAGIEPEQKVVQNQLRLLSPDGLFHVSSCTEPPNRWICFLQMDFGEDRQPSSLADQRVVITGAGLLISPRHILTAGECLFTRSRMHPLSRLTANGSVRELSPVKAVSVLVASGPDGNGVGLLGSASVVDSRFLQINERWEASRATNANFNFGLITLKRPMPSNQGFWGGAGNRIFPLVDAELQNAVIHTAGYPAHKCPPISAESPACTEKSKGKTQWSTIGKISEVGTHTFTHDMPIFSGWNGAPIWIERGEDRILVGISATGPQAVRITSDLLEQLREWMAKDGV